MAYTLTGIAIAILLAPVTFGIWNLVCFRRNYQLALGMGIPIKVLLASGDNPVWILVSSPVLAMIKLVFGECDITNPGHNWLYVCNAEAVNDIFKRRDDFDRPPDLLAVLGVFGPNISTAVGADWQRQRKITSAPFSDQNNSLVWTESLRQASEVLQFWKTFSDPVTRTDVDTRTLSLHVLSGAGFGKSYSFQKSAEPPRKGHTFNYRDSIQLILENCLLILVLGPKLLGTLAQWTGLFGNWARIGQATIDFKDHMTSMLHEEKKAIAEGRTRSPTITNSLIRASEEMKSEDGGSFKGLTEEEIYGNIFVYNFAGHDTTATTLNWALYLLAAFPEVQDWMAEEINHVLGDMGSDPMKWEYKDVYPRLHRCQEVLYETLRLWNPLIDICKSTFLLPQPLTVGDKTITIPPDTRIIPNSNAIHTLPRYWGEDSMTWKPSRWISSSSVESKTAKSSILNESLITPKKGSYVAWSDGIRPCPGKKFSQVEFVATMMSMFRQHRVEVLPNKGETVQEARERVKECVNDNVIVLLPQMRNPKSVGLRWFEV